MNRSRARQPILVIGGTGQIGWELQRTLSHLGDVVAPTSRDLDLTQPDNTNAAIDTIDPSVIVNAAGYTAVDAAEQDRDTAWAVNAIGPRVLAEAARRKHIPLVHLSTDYVFDGRARRPYREDDPPRPLNIYGASKLAGERAVQESGCAHLIVRTSWVYGLRGRNFLRTMLKRAQAGEPLRVVADQIGAPTWSRLVAEGIQSMLVACASENRFDVPELRQGVFHVSASGEASWYEFASAIFRSSLANALRLAPQVAPISTKEYAAPATRPAYSVLDTTRAREIFGISLPSWSQQLEMVCASDDVAKDSPD
jgi:dTDP-4-dehydrorhamnose reductase